MKKSLLIFLTCLAGVLHADGLALKTTPTLLEEANISGLVSNLSKTATASARVNKLLYQSADKFTDLTSGKSGFVTVAEDANGKIGAYVDEVGRVAKGGGKTQLLAKLDNLNVPNVKNWINRLDDASDAALLKKVDDLATSDPAKLSKLDDLYDPNKFSLPADRPIVNGQKVAGDFTTTKVIDGQSVSVYYDKNGFANLKPYSAGDEYRYISTTLDGTSADMLAANNAIRQKFLGQPNKFKWNGQTTWFEIKDANGNWVKHTWHHYQDGKSMFPVPSKIHTASEGGFPHTGGKAIIDRGLQNIFE